MCQTLAKRIVPGVLFFRNRENLKIGQDLPVGFASSRALQELRGLALSSGVQRGIHGQAFEVLN